MVDSQGRDFFVIRTGEHSLGTLPCVCSVADCTSNCHHWDIELRERLGDSLGLYLRNDTITSLLKPSTKLIVISCNMKDPGAIESGILRNAMKYSATNRGPCFNE
jgi:hypothetical protein